VGIVVSDYAIIGLRDGAPFAAGQTALYSFIHSSRASGASPPGRNPRQLPWRAVVPPVDMVTDASAHIRLTL
jgi:hypothetical protein